MYIYFSETLLYLSFAFTGGYLFLAFVPQHAKPIMYRLTDFFHYAILGIPLFSFIPILRTTFILRDYAGDLTFLQVLAIVLKDYSFGNAWLSILFISTAMLGLSIVSNLEKKIIQITLSVMWGAIILAHGWASHPASFSFIVGLPSQSLHVAAMSVWLGILIIVAWFTRGEWNWTAFVRWYTPLAIGSMVIIVVAGLTMMILFVENYLNSWSINYGQALLLKHLVFVPLILLGFLNGFLTKITNGGLLVTRLQWWLRIETLVALSILFITAYMGVQEPPHEGEFDEPEPSRLYQYLHGESSDTFVQWTFNLPSILLIVIGVFSLGILYICYKRNWKKLFVLSLLFSVLGPFLGLILSVQ